MYEFTRFPSRDYPSRWTAGTAPLTEIFPPHFIAPDKHKVECIGDYVLKPNTKRANNNILKKTFLTLDVDRRCINEEQYLQQFRDLKDASYTLSREGYEHLYYSSYSHGRPRDDAPFYFGYRLVVPFLVPLDNTNSNNIAADFKAIAEAMTKGWELPGNIMALSQPWYVPSVPDAAGLAAAEYKYVAGRAFDWREMQLKPAAPLPEYVVDDAPADYVPVDARTVLARLVERVNRFRDQRLAAAVGLVMNLAKPTATVCANRHTELVLPLTLAIANTSKPGETSEDLIKVLEPWCRMMSAEDGRPWLGEAMRALRGAMSKQGQWRAERAAKAAAEDAATREFEEGLERTRRKPAGATK